MGQITIGDVARTQDTGMMHSVIIEHPLSRSCNRTRAKQLQALAMRMMDIIDAWRQEDMDALRAKDCAKYPPGF
jgi:hypothetical protein